MQTKNLVQVRAFVEGYVQAVGFRYFVREEARPLNLTGWVRNLSDGRVELLAEGTRENCEAFLKRVGQGPRMSQVSRIETHWGASTGEEQSFRVAPTSKSSR